MESTLKTQVMHIPYEYVDGYEIFLGGRVNQLGVPLLKSLKNVVMGVFTLGML